MADTQASCKGNVYVCDSLCVYTYTTHRGTCLLTLCVSVCVRGTGSMLVVEYRQWCAGKKSNSQVWREELWSVAAANFDGVNILTEADFKQPNWSHWMQSWKGTCRVSLHQSGKATSNTGQAAGFQHHSLSKTGKLPSFESRDIALTFIPKSICTSQTELFIQPWLIL